MLGLEWRAAFFTGGCSLYKFYLCRFMAYFRINTARTSLNWFNAVEDRRSILVIAIKRTCKHEVSSFAGYTFGSSCLAPLCHHICSVDWCSYRSNSLILEHCVMHIWKLPLRVCCGEHSRDHKLIAQFGAKQVYSDNSLGQAQNY